MLNVRSLGLVVVAGLAIGCGGGGDTGGNGGTSPPPPPPPAPTYAIGGAVSGLTGSGLVLQNNGASDLPVAAGATSYTFGNAFTTGAQYKITVKTAPTSPSQTCTVANDNGQVANANVDAPVTCTVNSFAVGGTITGLIATGLVLQLNGGSPLQIAAGSGGFSFPPIASGAAYAVTVSAQPAGQSCVVANGTGTVGNANVGNVVVTCQSITYTIGGAIAGLTGSGLVLQNNGKSDLAVNAGATQFTFAGSVPPGTTYSVSVSVQPTGQSCVIANGTGTASANVTNVVVNCVANTATVGGTVTGLTAAGLQLQLNGGTPLAIPAGATSFTFPSPVAPNSAYTVTISGYPAGQTCSVANGSGTVAASGNVTNVAVGCSANAPNSYTVGGSITGLSAPGLVLGTNGKTVSAPSGATTFTLPALPTGTSYNVGIVAAPSNYFCQVTNGAGTIGSANVTNVAVACRVLAYKVKGVINGLIGTGLNLLLNGGGRLVIPAGATSFVFGFSISSGATYTVTAPIQPTNPKQTCTVVNGTGTMGTADVTDVVINCVTTYQVGGTVGPGILWSNGGTLLLNGGSPIPLVVDRPSFSWTLAPGAPYSVTVGTQPSTPAHDCTVTNGSGVVGAADITNIQVTCIPRPFVLFGIANGHTGGLKLAIEAERNGAALPSPGPLTPQSLGKYAFPDLYQVNDQYHVYIATQPPGQTCDIKNATGQVPAVPGGPPAYRTGVLNCVNNVTAPLSGVYTVLLGIKRYYLAFWPDGSFALATRADDATCPDNGNGIEYGIYNYNAGTSTLTLLDVTTDTNGGCGLATPGSLPPPITATTTGTSITLNTDAGPVTLTKVTSTPGTLVGAWTLGAGQDGTYAVFQPDNTYVLVLPQGAGSNGLPIRPGYERACYTATASAITADLSAACKPDGNSVVDNNGEQGFSSAGGPVPFTITGPNTMSIGQKTLVRIP